MGAEDEEEHEPQEAGSVAGEAAHVVLEPPQHPYHLDQANNFEPAQHFGKAHVVTAAIANRTNDTVQGDARGKVWQEP